MPSTKPLSYQSPAPAPERPKKWRGAFGWVLFIGLAVMLFMLLSKQETAVGRVSLSDFVDHLRNGRVSVVTLEGDEVTGRFTSPQPATGEKTTLWFRTSLPKGVTGDWAFIQWLLEHRRGADVYVRGQNSLVTNILLPLIPWLLIFGFIWFFVFRPLRKSTSIKPTQVLITWPGRWVPDEPQKTGEE
jgi:ATP-dependent Zn protease